MRRAAKTYAGALALGLLLTGCQPPEPLVPDRHYLLRRNAVDATKPCLVARFASSPVKVVRNIGYVPAMVNGVTTLGFLDTGSEATAITPAMAQLAKVKLDPNASPHRAYGVAGSFSVPLAQADTLQVGMLKRTMPPPSYLVDFAGSNKEKIGVLIGSAMLDGFDWDMDFPHGRMTAYRTQNCHDIDPLWQTKSSELPVTRGINPKFSVIANMVGLPVNITIPVQFDGGSLKAIFDTGAGATYLTREGAHKAGISNAQLDRDPVVDIKAINGGHKKVRRHIVPEFVVAEDLVRNFLVYVAEHLNRNDKFDMLLGMDWIGSHHLWLSYTTDSIYVDSNEKKPSSWKPAPQMDN